MMRRLVPALNLTAVLAISVLAELIFSRILQAVFLPSQSGSLAERSVAGFAAFVSNFSAILALLLVVVGLLHALRSQQVFPRSMRITVSTIGLFFTVLAGLGVLWISTTPRYNVHLRISHGFLMFFLALGVWHGPRAWRFKLGVTLFALPFVIQAAALFVLRMGWSRIDPIQMVRAANGINLAAMIATPVLFAPLAREVKHVAIALGAWIVFAFGLTAAALFRFDMVQAVAYYGLHIDLTGLGSSAERLYTGALVMAFACLGSATVSSLVRRGPYRLTGWGLLLMAAAGSEIVSAKPALFTLCGLLALAIATASDKATVTDVASSPQAN